MNRGRSSRSSRNSRGKDGRRGKGKRRGPSSKPFYRKKKRCRFCTDHIDYIDYKDVSRLERFTTERGKILPSRIFVSTTFLRVAFLSRTCPKPRLRSVRS